MTTATTRRAVPRDAITVRLTPRLKARLLKLQLMLDTNRSEVINRLVIHGLATLEKGRPLESVVPSEQVEQLKPPEPQ